MATRKPEHSHHHGDLKKAAIAMAVEAAQTGTVETMSLRGLSRELGVSSGAIYRHFEDKDALLGCVAQEGFDTLAERFETEVPYASKAVSANDAVSRFEKLAIVYVNFSRENYGLWRLMFGPYGLTAAPASTDRPSTYDWLAKSLQELAQFAVISNYSPERQFFAWSSLHGMADLHASPAMKLRTTEEAVKDQCRLILQAFKGNTA